MGVEISLKGKNAVVTGGAGGMGRTTSMLLAEAGANVMVADMDEAVAWLNSRGIETEPVRWDPYTEKRMTFFRDPDGLPLELHE